jgi:hypothetical protein
MQDQSLIYRQLSDIRKQVSSIIDRLTSVKMECDEALGQIAQLGFLIDSLPFPSDHYSVAKNRLRNAHRYFVCDEVGAARYELWLLLGQLGRTFI